MATKKPEVKASHPFHSAIPGQQGGSLPKMNNNHRAACDMAMAGMRAKVPVMLGHLKPPKIVK